MAELAAAPRRGDPPALSPYLRPLGWSMQQSRSTGEWYYVRTAPDGRRVRQRESPGYGWPAARLLCPDQADNLYEEAKAEAIAACAADTAGQRCYICFGEGDEDGLVRMCACRDDSGFAHVSCLAELAKRSVADAEARDLDDVKWERWYTCGMCEQKYHGVVLCALTWACWKTYLGRPETDQLRGWAMTALGNGLSAVGNYEDALSTQEAALAMMRRIGDSEDEILVVQSNLAGSYYKLGRPEEALRLSREVYSGRLKLDGEEHISTVRAAYDCASSLSDLQRFEEAKRLLRKTFPVLRRVLGESNDLTFKIRTIYARALYWDDAATLDDLREAVTSFEDLERTWRRVLGGAHPFVTAVESDLQDARAALCAREAPDDETVDGSAQEDEADDAESPTPVAAPMPAEATVAPRPPPPPPLPRRVTSILCCW